MSTDTATVPATVPVVQPIRIDWAGGYALIAREETAGMGRAERRQRTKALGEIAKVHGRRRADRPDTPSTKYRDPATLRRLDQVWGDLPFDKDQYGEVLGQYIFPGWVITQTDGNYAVAELGEPYGPNKDRAPLFKDEPITWLGRIPPEAWRAYAPLRPFMHPKTRAIRWVIGPQGFAWYVKYDGDEAKGEYRMVGPDAGVMSTDELTTILLADGYLWACRGLDYPKVGIVSHPSKRHGDLDALVLEYCSIGVVRRIVIMGMVEK